MCGPWWLYYILTRYCDCLGTSKNNLRRAPCLVQNDPELQLLIASWILQNGNKLQTPIKSQLMFKMTWNHCWLVCLFMDLLTVNCDRSFDPSSEWNDIKLEYDTGRRKPLSKDVEHALSDGMHWVSSEIKHCERPGQNLQNLLKHAKQMTRTKSIKCLIAYTAGDLRNVCKLFWSTLRERPGTVYRLNWRMHSERRQ